MDGKIFESHHCFHLIVRPIMNLLFGWDFYKHFLQPLNQESRPEGGAGANDWDHKNHVSTLKSSKYRTSDSKEHQTFLEVRKSHSLAFFSFYTYNRVD